ncbi:hypothetical protein J6Y50_10860 [bacterium]|nr:hypothetical protein [bacterium]
MISVEEAVRKNDAVMKILNSLSKGASFGVSIEGGEEVIVSREKCGISFRESGGDKPDFVVSMPEEVFSQLFSESSSVLPVQDFLAFAAQLLTGEKEKVSLVIYANFLKLTLHGYPKLLSLGGTAFWKVLKENGVGSIFAIEKKLAAFRNK